MASTRSHNLAPDQITRQLSDTDTKDPALRGLSLTEILYIRPKGFLCGAAAARALEDNVALPLAGGPYAFTLCEVVTQEPSGGQIAHTVPVSALAADGVEGLLSGALDPFVASRSAIQGLSFDRALLMGVINVTPDSFSDGGQFASTEAAIAHGRALADAGADILDVGGESTRPGAASLPVTEELARVMPVIEGLHGLCRISVDTRHADVMEKAIAAGATIINDVTALTGERGSLNVAAASGAHIVLMHGFEPGGVDARLTPEQAVLAVFDYLRDRVAACRAAGISEQRLIADPGIGFGKTSEQNLELLRQVALFHGLGCPLLLGVSRKLGRRFDPAERLPESLASAMWVRSQGAQIVRVHDVAETRRAMGISSRLSGEGKGA